MGWTSSSARDCAALTFCHCAWSSAARSKSSSAEAASRSAASGASMDLAAGVEEGLHGGGLGCVSRGALGRAGLVAGREALLHLLVDAAGMLGIRREVFDAAAEFEEVEDGVAVAVGGGARGERAVEVGQRALAEAVGGVDARVGVVGGEAEEERRAQLEAAARFVEAEDGGGGVVEGERRLELRAGDGVVDAGYAVAQVEALGLRVRRREDAGDAAAEVGGAGEVGLGLDLPLDARAVEGEDSGQRGNRAQGFRGVLRREGYGLLELERRGHRRIVDGDGLAY